MKKLIFLPMFLLMAGNLLWSQGEGARYSNPIKEILKGHPEYFGEILDNPDKYEVQILYTQVDRRPDNLPNFRRFSYGLDESQFFYPAGAVQMPVAMAALEKLHQLGIVGLTRNTTMRTGAVRPSQIECEVDSLAADLRPTVGGYVEEMLVAGDTNAFNRLYEFLGQGYLNDRILDLGYRNFRIVHRLGEPLPPFENAYINPVSFLDPESRLLYHQGLVYSEAQHSLELQGTKKGIGYFNSEGMQVDMPFDFGQKNFISLRVLQDLLQNLVLPELAEPSTVFRLGDDDYKHLLRCMAMLPRESAIGSYRSMPDKTGNLLMYADRPNDTIPATVRIFNISGEGFGWLTDVAYVVDFKNKVEFLLAATIHVNSDGVYNDEQYDYEEIGYPFLGNLGRLIYELELQRPRENRPDLRKFELGWGR
jgi:hypothetical protein